MKNLLRIREILNNNSKTKRVSKALLAVILLATLVLSLGLVVAPVLSTPGGPWYVSPTGNDAHDCLSSGTACLTIQAAITKASAGDTVNVAAGTYVEAVKVTESIVLKGAAGAIIKPDNTTPLLDGGIRRCGIYVESGVDGVTIDGFEIDGTGGTVHYGIYLRDSDNSIVKNSKVHDIVNQIAAPGSDVAGVGIIFYGWNQGISGALAEDNTVYNTGRTGIFVGGWGPTTFRVSSGIIRGNTVYNAWQGPTDDHGGGIQINAAKDSIIQSNTVHDTFGPDPTAYGSGIYVGGSLDNVLGSPTNHITGNDVYNNYYGIVINTGDATWVDTQDGTLFLGPPTVNFNNIHGNTAPANAGLWERTGDPAYLVNAESNWWGDASGPYHLTLNVGGLGNAVSDNVDFVPWLAAPWPSEVWVSTTGDDSNLGTASEPFRTIQKGVDTVASGGIVHVMAGTYTATSLASVVITKPLTLSGEDKGTTIIDAGAWGTSGGWPRGIHSYADNVVIEKFTIRGFRGDGVTGGYGVVFRDFGHDDEKQGETYIYYQNAVLRDAIIEDCYSSVYALVHQHLTVEAVTITNSLADGIFIARYSDYATVNSSTVINSGDHGIWVGYCWKTLGPSNHAVIANNVVDGAREGGISFVASNDALIEGNTVTNVKGEEPEGTGGWSRGAISLKDGVSDVVVRNNEVYGNDGMGTGSGRGLGIDGTSSNVQVTGNTIRDNAGGGIKVIGPVTGWTCNFNNIYGNTGYGAENTIGTMLNFKNNWWGSATGPNHSSNPSGTGDKVSDNVDFRPWLAGEVVTETVTNDVVDAKAQADTEVSVSGTATVTIANYTDNPGGSPSFSTIGKYVDIHVADVSSATEIEVRVYYKTAELVGHVETEMKLWWWDSGTPAWVQCSDSGVTYPAGGPTYRGYIWAKIRSDTTPNLSQLTGTPFGGGDSSGMLRLWQPDTAVQTTISLNGAVRDDWGLNWVKLLGGNYVLSVSDVPGWAKPTQVRVLIYSYGSSTPESDTMVNYLVHPIPVYAGKVTEVRVSFSQLGYLHVMTSPAVAGTIYVNGVPMNDWGCWVPLLPDTYTVSFGDVPGYSKPADQTVSVAAGTSVTTTGTYTIT